MRILAREPREAGDLGILPAPHTKTRQPGPPDTRSQYNCLRTLVPRGLHLWWSSFFSFVWMAVWSVSLWYSNSVYWVHRNVAWADDTPGISAKSVTTKNCCGSSLEETEVLFFMDGTESSSVKNLKHTPNFLPIWRAWFAKDFSFHKKLFVFLNVQKTRTEQHGSLCRRFRHWEENQHQVDRDHISCWCWNGTKDIGALLCSSGLKLQSEGEKYLQFLPNICLFTCFVTEVEGRDPWMDKPMDTSSRVIQAASCAGKARLNRDKSPEIHHWSAHVLHFPKARQIRMTYLLP